MNFGPYTEWYDGFPGEAVMAIVGREVLADYGDFVFRTVVLHENEIPRYRIAEDGKTWRLLTYHPQSYAIYERGEWPNLY